MLVALGLSVSWVSMSLVLFNLGSMHDLVESTAAARKGGKGRLIGIDGARALALLGMMAVHILPSQNADGTVAWHYQIAGGRSSALFAVLAGVGLALANGRETPPRGRDWLASGAGTLGRAAVLGFLGLFLGEPDSGVAVILVHYALLFAIGVIFLRLPLRWLAGLAVLWAVAAPVLSQIWRSGGPQPGPQVPRIDSLLDPVSAFGDLFLTGYYPVLTWITYLLAGLAIGRSNLRDRRTPWLLLGAGSVLAVGSRLVSAWLLGSFGGQAAVGELPTQLFGTTPTSSLWFLAVATPHSGSPIDLFHTTGAAMAIIGLLLLAAQAGKATVAWLAGAGGMTLSLYTCHVLGLASGIGLGDRPSLVALHAIGALVAGAVWRHWVGRGPLETMAANVAGVLKNAFGAPATPRAG